MKSEIATLANSLAEQVFRSHHRDLDFISSRIRHALNIFEERIENLAAKSMPREPLSSYTDKGREEHRTHNLKSFTGYGFGCDLCGGGHDTSTFMSLRLGSYKARLFIDLCQPCTKRLAAVIDARLEDKRCTRNGNK